MTVKSGSCEVAFYSARDRDFQDCRRRVSLGNEMLVEGQLRVLCSEHRREVAAVIRAGMTAQLHWVARTVGAA